ncbi:NAD-dependent epimerase/dehydratase family protein [Oerskovia turbata]
MSTAERATTLVVGARGLLGRAVLQESAARGSVVTSARVRWSDPDDATQDLAVSLDEARAAGGGPLRILWCAGAGVTATPQDVLDAELTVFRSFLDVVASLGPEERSRTTFFYASSAGGVYAGASEPPFSEDTVPSPLAPYGHAKLQAEAALARLTNAGARVLIGRIANIYGPGQDLGKPQGLISQLCLAHHTARPIGVYVSLDTLRDYVFVDDCAEMILDMVERGEALPDEVGPVTKIIASQQSVSIAMLLGEMRRIFKRAPRVVLASSPHARQQARDLRFRSKTWPEIDQRVFRTLASGVAITDEDIGMRVRSAR